MTLKEDLKSGTLDLNKLSPSKRNRVKRFLTGDKRALRKRDKLLGLRFTSEDIETWHKKAKAENKSITEWVEDRLNRE